METQLLALTWRTRGSRASHCQVAAQMLQEGRAPRGISWVVGSGGYPYICDAKADCLKEADPAKRRIKNVHIIQKK